MAEKFGKSNRKQTMGTEAPIVTAPDQTLPSLNVSLRNTP